MHNGVVFDREGEDFTYIPIAKNGSSSILATLWESAPRHHPKAKSMVMCDKVPTSRALAMFREPTARAWSAYLMMRRNPRLDYEGGPGERVHAWWPDNTLAWDEWLDSLVKNRFHPRLTATMIPQHEYLCSPVKYEYVAWDFKEMGERLGVELPCINSAAGKWKVRGQAEGYAPPMPDITPEMEYNLHNLYPADYRIWELIS
jgi:hypothetical protein